MKHLQTFESFTELNEATKANPNDIKVGDLVRYAPKHHQNRWFKKAAYGKVTDVYKPDEFNMTVVAWSDGTKDQPQFAMAPRPGDQTMDPWKNADLEKALKAFADADDTHNMKIMYAKTKLEDATIWNPA